MNEQHDTPMSRLDEDTRAYTGPDNMQDLIDDREMDEATEKARREIQEEILAGPPYTEKELREAGRTLIQPTINLDPLKWRYRTHLRATEEMALAHQELHDANAVLLDHFPEMGDRTDPLPVLLKEVLGLARAVTTVYPVNLETFEDPHGVILTPPIMDEEDVAREAAHLASGKFGETGPLPTDGFGDVAPVAARCTDCGENHTPARPSGRCWTCDHGGNERPDTPEAPLSTTPPHLTVTITADGPQGCGKTVTLQRLSALLVQGGFRCAQRSLEAPNGETVVWESEENVTPNKALYGELPAVHLGQHVGPLDRNAYIGGETKRLHDLTEVEHARLKASGLLWELYPDATGDWSRDSSDATVTTNHPSK